MIRKSLRNAIKPVKKKKKCYYDLTTLLYQAKYVKKKFGFL